MYVLRGGAAKEAHAIVDTLRQQIETFRGDFAKAADEEIRLEICWRFIAHVLEEHAYRLHAGEYHRCCRPRVTDAVTEGVARLMISLSSAGWHRIMDCCRGVIPNLDTFFRAEQGAILSREAAMRRVLHPAPNDNARQVPATLPESDAWPSPFGVRFDAWHPSVAARLH